MSRLKALVTGELDRLNKYNLFKAHFVVLLLWLALAWFLEGDQLLLFVPVIFLMESTMMTILLVGATLFYEKQEHTVNSVMVTPVTENEYLSAKVIVSVINALVTVVIVSVAIYLMKQVTFNYPVMILAVSLVTVVHALIGIWLSYHAKNFTAVLVNLMAYAFLFIVPTLFATVGIISADVARLFIVLPPEAGGVVIGAALVEAETGRLLFSYSYLILLALGVYRFLVKPQFGAFVMRETGV